MRSMTGFGQARGDNASHAVTVTLRGVNHRYLELRLRLNDEYRHSESDLRQLLTAEMHRGRVEAVVEVRSSGEREARVEVHRGVVRAAHAALHQLVEEGLIARELTAGDLTRLPEALTVEVAPDRWSDEDHELLLVVAGEALERFVASRCTEGDKLLEVLAGRAEQLAGHVDELGRRQGSSLEQAATALAERVDRLVTALRPGQEEVIDPQRLAQEVALLADKADISEELDRLGAHLDHFRELLEGTGDAQRGIGRRLDFLLQEIFRELNTLGAKCRNSDMTRTVLDAKGLCEQLREQVQNVE